MKSLQQCIHIYVSQLLISVPETGWEVPEEMELFLEQTELLLKHAER
jgi:hypothetical protein